MIKLVAAADGFVGGKQRLARERQVTDGVQHLVPHEFVGEAQAFRIEHAVFADHQRILERGAKRIARAPQLGDVAHEAECTCARDLAAERVGLDVERKRLLADQRMIEIDFGLDPEAVLIRAAIRRRRRPWSQRPA